MKKGDWGIAQMEEKHRNVHERSYEMTKIQACLISTRNFLERRYLFSMETHLKKPEDGRVLHSQRGAITDEELSVQLHTESAVNLTHERGSNRDSKPFAGL